MPRGQRGQASNPVSGRDCHVQLGRLLTAQGHPSKRMKGAVANPQSLLQVVCPDQGCIVPGLRNFGCFLFVFCLFLTKYCTSDLVGAAGRFEDPEL